MFISPTEVFHILEQYKYFLIFPVAIIEGPIIIIITGFLTFLGYLKIYVALPVLIVADVLGDSMYYTIGKFWKKSDFVKRWARFLGYDESSEVFLEEHFKKHKGKTFLIAKISHGVGGVVQVSSGIAGVSYRDFLFYSVLGTVPKTTLLFFVGFYLGSSYLQIDSMLNYVAHIVLGMGLLIFAYFMAIKYAKRFFTPKV